MKRPLAFIVEDEANLSRIFEASLQSVGFRTEATLDGAAAQLYLATCDHPPELVVLDLHLPNVSGGELLAEMRRNYRFHDTRIMLVTSDRYAGEIYRKDADLLLLKPISIVQLQTLALRVIRSVRSPI